MIFQALRLIVISFLTCLGLCSCEDTSAEVTQKDSVYQCPIHPEEVYGEKDSCRICNMELIEVDNKVPIELIESIVELDTTQFLEKLMINGKDSKPFKDIVVGNYNFSIVMNKDGDTTYWSTTDSTFKTPEGWTIGTKFSELPKKIKDEVTKVENWGYYVKLNSGWELCFCEGQMCTGEKLTEKSLVLWLFKRVDQPYNVPNSTY